MVVERLGNRDQNFGSKPLLVVGQRERRIANHLTPRSFGMEMCDLVSQRSFRTEHDEVALERRELRPPLERCQAGSELFLREFVLRSGADDTVSLKIELSCAGAHTNHGETCGHTSDSGEREQHALSTDTTNQLEHGLIPFPGD